MRYQEPFMKFVMTPPQQEQAKYDMYAPQVSTMRVVSNACTSGLGDVPIGSSSGESNNNSSWIMPVVIIVVSAMALMTLYAVLNKR